MGRDEVLFQWGDQEGGQGLGAEVKRKQGTEWYRQGNGWHRGLRPQAPGVFKALEGQCGTGDTVVEGSLCTCVGRTWSFL